MYVARYGGEIGGSNAIQKIANKNKWLLRSRVHSILVNLRQPSTTPPPHHTPTWQIKALLMLAPSVVTPQNQYFPANAERMSVHCLKSANLSRLGKSLGPRGCISNTSLLSAVYGFNTLFPFRSSHD